MIRTAAMWADIKNGGTRGDRGQAAALRAAYERAKGQRDADAATVVTDRFATDGWVDRIVDDMQASPARDKYTLVWPTPSFVRGADARSVRPAMNALPAAIAAYLSDVLGASLNETIVQAARPGRTKLSRMERFLYQPMFDGEVDQDSGYIIVDDVCSTGGTLAALRHHIVSSGGTIVSVCVLGNRTGVDQTFPIADRTHSVLLSVFDEGIIPFWLEEVGHDVECLTDLEGNALLEWWGDREQCGKPPLQCLRACFDSIRSRGHEPRG